MDDVWLHALEQVGEAEGVPETGQISDYVTEQWMERERLQWNHYHTQGPRTTHHLEGCHSKLKKLVRHAHPNIYDLITFLQ